jgi:carbon monoxide dehydrogenase subunit G
MSQTSGARPRRLVAMRFTNTITIDRSPNSVFAYLADLENLPSWNYAIQETRQVTPGPVAVGSRFLQIRTVPAYREESLEVVEYEAGHRLTIQGTLNTLPARFGYLLESDGRTTVLTNTADLEIRGPLTLVAPLAVRQIKSAVAANLEVLKQILETAP